jgi:hypothetical protein
MLAEANYRDSNAENKHSALIAKGILVIARFFVGTEAIR